MENRSETAASSSRSPAWLGWLLLIVVLIGTFVLGLLATSILRRREEARRQPPLQPIGEWEMDAAKWGINYPRQYDSYRRTSVTGTKTKFGGSDPRDYLADKETTANIILFAGYPFSEDYRQARGHWYAIEDVTSTKRLRPATPGTCFTCKSPDAPRLMHEMGIAEFYAAKFSDLKSQVTHPIGCFDCHEPNSMQLRVTRPALREAFERQGRNIDQVTHQEMRTLVCAQCHVEYYFKGDGKYLTFPWDRGMSVEEMEAYYDGQKFSDWTHAISGAPMVKMQHPDYEIYGFGVHAFRNVSCADCHMPYRTEGGVKFTDHHVQSPLLNIANSCAVCHRWSEEEIRTRVETIQDKAHEGRGRAERTIAQAHFDIAAAMQAGAKDDELTDVRDLVRKAQLRWDCVAANNGMGFHAPQECMRILEAAVDLAGQCRVQCAQILARHGVSTPVEYPDFSTKEKATGVLKQFVDKKPPKLVGGKDP